MRALGHRFPVFTSWASAQVARQSFAKAPRLKVAAMRSFTLTRVKKSGHLERYYAHVRHEREDSALII